MTKETLARSLAMDRGTTITEAKDLVDTVVNSVVLCLQRGEKVDLRGLGSFTVLTRKARKGRNPRTGVVVDIPEKKYVRFRQSESLTKD